MNVAWMPDHSSSFPSPLSKGHRAQVEKYANTLRLQIILRVQAQVVAKYTALLSCQSFIFWSEPLSPAASWGTWQAAEKAGRVKTAAVPIPCQTYKKLPVPIFSSGTNVQFSSHPVTITRGNLTVEHLTNNKLSFSSLGRTPDWLRLISCQFFRVAIYCFDVEIFFKSNVDQTFPLTSFHWEIILPFHSNQHHWEIIQISITGR